jgi:hypothetical protein
LNLFVSPIFGVLYVLFHKVALLVKDLLPECRRDLLGIDLFDIASAPAPTAMNLIPVPSPAARQFLPMTKLPFIETTLLLIHPETAFSLLSWLFSCCFITRIFPTVKLRTA